MESAHLSRRAFLGASGGLLLAATAAGAVPAAALTGSGKKRAALFIGQDVYASPAPQRVAFVLARGLNFVSGPPAEIAFGLLEGKRAKLGGFEPTTLHSRGLAKGRGIYTVEATLPEAGNYVGFVRVGGERLSLAFEVQAQSVAPPVGAPAIKTPSPTPTATLDVDPICTRSPECPLHDASIDTLIGNGKPLALMFATPARCQTRFCGPVLNDLLRLRDKYADKVNFAHVEIYRDTRSTKLVPTVEAWNLPGEPWLFGIDSGGTVVSRLDSAFARDEQDGLLQGLIA